MLDSESYGTSRGTGVLVRKNGKWKISQYALTFPIPNDLADGMTAEIRTFEDKKKQ
ncbi:MAG: nuclear transport factor 2 family protein [Gemmatimonadales bacterium]